MMLNCVFKNFWSQFPCASVEPSRQLYISKNSLSMKQSILLQCISIQKNVSMAELQIGLRSS